MIQQTIGFDDNTDVFYAMFDGWAVDQQAKDSALSDEVLSCFRSNMYDGEAVFSVGYEAIERLTHPLLILREMISTTRPRFRTTSHQSPNMRR